MKLLFIDIETSPNLADVWELWNQNISLSQLRESSRVICFAASWYDEDEVMWYGEDSVGHDDMIAIAWGLLDEADAVCDYNGKKFDIPTLNKEFLLNDFLPPSPFQHIDLLEVIRRRFRFPSNKLEYIARVLGTTGKVKHSGHELWIRCLNDDPKAWAEMEEYNKKDVALLKEIYPRILPWTTNHPAVGLYEEEPEVTSCPYCDSVQLTKQGFAFTKTGKYQRYHCNDCGGWSQDNKRMAHTAVRGIG